MSSYEQINGEESPRRSDQGSESQETQQRSILRRTNSSIVSDAVFTTNSGITMSATTTTTSTHTAAAATDFNSNNDRSYSITSDSTMSSSAPLLYNPADYINQHQQHPFEIQAFPSVSTLTETTTTKTFFSGRHITSKDGGPQRRKSFLYHQHPQPVQIRLWRLVWFATLILGEQGLFLAMVHRCSWPENYSWEASESALKDRYRIVIIADPQLTDWYSYKQSGIGLWLTEFYTDLFMRRSFRRIHAKFQPDAVLFLGDLLDGGRETMDRKRFDRNRKRFLERVFDTARSGWNPKPLVMDQEDVKQGSKDGDHYDEEEWEREGRSEGSEQDLRTGERESFNDDGIKNNVRDVPGLKGDTDKTHNSNNISDARAIRRREEEIDISGHYSQLLQVPLDADKRALIRSSGRSVRLYVAGNHDYGFGDTIIRKAVKRYKREFGSVNYEIKVGNHTIVVLDTLALSSNITSIRNEAQEFLTKIAKEKPTSPRILFTHIPLFRLSSTFCGDRREANNSIVDDRGEQYQNLVNSTLSKEILRSIRPDMIFSGDDHDWCEIAHDLDERLTPEVTLPTFSFAQGIKQPGFVLLSLYNPEEITKNVVSASMIVNTGDGTGKRMDVAMVSDRTTFAYDECLLPKQLAIYDFYIFLFLLTAGWLIVLRMRWMRHRRRCSADSVLVQWRQQPPGSPMIVNNDDDGGDEVEYEDDDEYCHDDDRSTSIPTDQVTQGSTTATRISPPQQWSRKQYPLMSEHEFSEVGQVENFSEKKTAVPLKTTVLFSPSIRRSHSPQLPGSPISPLMGNHNAGNKRRRRRRPSGYSIIKGVRQGDMEMVVGWCRDRLLRPMGSRLFWRMVFWDLWSIFRYVLSFYAVLLLVSLT